jgi:hypothetical protein
MDALKALAEQTTTSVVSTTSQVKQNLTISWQWVLAGALTAILAAGLVYYVMVYSRTRPLGGDNFTDMPKTEGFGGVAVGAGIPDCMRTSSEAAQLYALFDGRIPSAGEGAGADSFAEFTQLLSKLACLKKDLMSPSGIVEATKYPDFSTNSDIEQVSETTARCFAKTIPPRDLDLIFEKWEKRGTDLLSQLSTAAKLTAQEEKNAELTFAALWADVYSISKDQCLNTKVAAKIAGQDQEREPAPYPAQAVTESGPYKGPSIGAF